MKDTEALFINTASSHQSAEKQGRKTKLTTDHRKNHVNRDSCLARSVTDKSQIDRISLHGLSKRERKAELSQKPIAMRDRRPLAIFQESGLQIRQTGKSPGGCSPTPAPHPHPHSSRQSNSPVRPLLEQQSSGLLLFLLQRHRREACARREHLFHSTDTQMCCICYVVPKGPQVRDMTPASADARFIQGTGVCLCV